MQNKISKKLAVLTKKAFLDRVKKISGSLLQDLTSGWRTKIYELLGKQFSTSGSRIRYQAQLYPFMRTEELRKTLQLNVSNPKFQLGKDRYSATVRVTGILGPAMNKGFDYSDYINRNTIVKGYRTHAFKMLGFQINKSLEKVL